MAYKVAEETIEGIASAIRTKTGSNDEIQLQDFAEEILNIETGENTAAAAKSARDAEASAISAASSAQAAKELAVDAAAVARDAQVASDSAAQVKTDLNRAIEIVQNLEGFNSEAWAIGSRNGVSVTPGDPTYNNNAMYWCNNAHTLVENFENTHSAINVLATATLV